MRCDEWRSLVIRLREKVTIIDQRSLCIDEYRYGWGLRCFLLSLFDGVMRYYQSSQIDTSNPHVQQYHINYQQQRQQLM